MFLLRDLDLFQIVPFKFYKTQVVCFYFAFDITYTVQIMPKLKIIKTNKQNK